MADFATHFLFGREVLPDLPEEAARVCSYYRKAYNYGLQGPDLLMVHKFMTGGDEISELGSEMHEKKTDTLMYTLAHECECAGYSALGRCMRAYFYGFLLHYSLDSVIHPYVYAMIEKFLEERPDEDDGAFHIQIETDIDTLLYRRMCNDSVNSFQPFRYYGFGLLSEKDGRRELEPILERGRNQRLTYGAIEKLYVPMLKSVYETDVKESDIRDCITKTRTLRGFQYGPAKTGAFLAKVLSKTEKSRKRTLAMIKYKAPEWDALNMRNAAWTDFQGNGHTESVPQLLQIAGEKACRLVGQYSEMLENRSFLKVIHFEYDFEGERTSRSNPAD